MNITGIYSTSTRIDKPSAAKTQQSQDQGALESFNKIFQGAARRAETQSDRKVTRQDPQAPVEKAEADEKSEAKKKSESCENEACDPSNDPALAQAAANPAQEPVENRANPDDGGDTDAPRIVAETSDSAGESVDSEFTRALHAQQEQDAAELNAEDQAQADAPNASEDQASSVDWGGLKPELEVETASEEPIIQHTTKSRQPQPEDVIKELQTRPVATIKSSSPIQTAAQAKAQAEDDQPVQASVTVDQDQEPELQASVKPVTTAQTQSQNGDPNAWTDQSAPKPGINHSDAGKQKQTHAEFQAELRAKSPVAETAVAVTANVAGAADSAALEAQNAAALAAAWGSARSNESSQHASALSPAAQTAQGAHPQPELSEADQNRVAEQAMRGIKSVMNQKGGTLTLRLNPPDLGELKIRVELGNNAIRAQFEASNEHVANLLQRRMDSLRSSLESHGLRVDQLQAHSAGPLGGILNQTGDQQAGEDGRSKGNFQQGGGGFSQGAGQQNQQQQQQPDFKRELLNLVA